MCICMCVNCKGYPVNQRYTVRVDINTRYIRSVVIDILFTRRKTTGYHHHHLHMLTKPVFEVVFGVIFREPLFEEGSS